jgi:hypothetical protein
MTKMKVKQFNNDAVMDALHKLKEGDLDKISFLASNQHTSIQEYLEKMETGLIKWTMIR